jgi:hypothetical protein
VNDEFVALGLLPPEITSENSLDLAAALGFDAHAANDFDRSLAEFASADEATAPGGAFELRILRWRLDPNKELVRSALISTILATTLRAMDETDIRATILVTVIPTLFEISSVSLTEGDKRLLLVVRKRTKVVDKVLTSDEIYDALPKNVRSSLNRYDFADFIDKLRDVGVAAKGAHKGQVRIRPESERIPIISWR